jgi:peptidoglycan/LPS O-acetylase OafA/YrhL
MADSPDARAVAAGSHADPVRVPELDGFRGLAILLVLIWHYFVVPAHLPPRHILAPVLAALQLTWSGVDLFFVLSGFLIGGILLDNREATNLPRVFYTRRTCRIFPAYFAWVSLFLVAQAMNLARAVPWLFDLGPLQAWPYLLYVQNFSMASAGTLGANWLAVTWSLAIEEQFYVLLPLTIRLSPRRALPWALGVLVLLTPGVRLAVAALHPHGALAAYVLLPCRWDALFLGVFGAMLLRAPQQRGWLDAHPRLLATAFLVLLGGVGVLTARGSGIGSRTMTAVGYTWLAMFYLSLLWIVVGGPWQWVRDLLRHRALVLLGSLSYGIYLLHQGCRALLLFALRGQEVPVLAGFADFAVTALALAVTVAVAAASFRWFESPLIRLGHSARYVRPDH